MSAPERRSRLATVPIARRHERSWLLSMYALVAVIAVVVFLAENAAVTGDPLIPPVYLLEGTPGAEIAGKELPPGISHVVSLMFPKGIAAWQVISFQTAKYWWYMGPIRFVTIGALVTLLILLVGNATRRRVPIALALLAVFGLMATYFVSRMNTTDWGADQLDPSLGHSLPRYSALIYAVAALLALVGVVKAMQSRRWMAGLGVAGLLVCGWLGLRYLAEGEVRTSLCDASELVAAYEMYADQLDVDAPDDALFYTRFIDKFVWATRPTALLPTEPGSAREHIDYFSLVRSIESSIGSGFVPGLFELGDDDVRALTPLLDDLGFDLKKSAMGRTAYLDELLIRWEAWVVERTVSA